jgi:hypothetical protein
MPTGHPVTVVSPSAACWLLSQDAGVTATMSTRRWAHVPAVGAGGVGGDAAAEELHAQGTKAVHHQEDHLHHPIQSAKATATGLSVSENEKKEDPLVSGHQASNKSPMAAMTHR